MSRVPIVSAVCLSRLFSMMRLVLPWWGEMSSEVARRMMAVTASQRLMSQKVKGNSIFSIL